MKFNPLTEEQLNAPAYEAGKYSFRVIEAEEKTSKKGNPMIKVSLEISSGHRKPIVVNDFLLSNEKAQWKLSGFCKSIGKEELYKSGEMGVFDIKEQRGMAEFQYEEYEGKKYLRVKNYLEKDEQDIEPEQSNEELDDDIPF